jgi:hypothetical protein
VKTASPNEAGLISIYSIQAFPDLQLDGASEEVIGEAWTVVLEGVASVYQ